MFFTDLDNILRDVARSGAYSIRLFNFVPMLFGIFSFATSKFAILTLRYSNVRYFDPFNIVADKHISYSLFSISAI